MIIDYAQMIEGIWLSQYALREKPFKTSVPERTAGPVYSGQSPYPDVDVMCIGIHVFMLPSEHLLPPGAMSSGKVKYTL